MEIISSLIDALWQQDYKTLADPSLVWALYLILFMIIFLENGLLPAAFLPGDSLLILVGVLIAKDAMNFRSHFPAHHRRQLGCWLSYVQGKAGEYAIVQSWLGHCLSIITNVPTRVP